MFIDGVNISEYQRGLDLKIERLLIESYNSLEDEVFN